MNRRTFIKISSATAGLALAERTYAFAETDDRKIIRFGVVTDLHYAKRNPAGTRHYKQSRDKLNDAIKIFNESDLDFIVTLGDSKDMTADADSAKSLAFLDEIEAVFQQFKGPKYHVLGNHDMDCISKTDFLKHTANSGEAKGKSYYSFVHKGVKFITLDANYNEDGSDYDRGNFDWTKAYIPAGQKQWLANELDVNYPVIIFVHQLLDSFSGLPRSLYVRNAAEVVKILERRNNVLAVFQGHHHAGHYSFRNGTHYFTHKAMIEGTYPKNNSFAIVEINRSSGQFDKKLYGAYGSHENKQYPFKTNPPKRKELK
jgi:alkaline phosphatase